MIRLIALSALLAACGSSPPVTFYALPTGDPPSGAAEDGLEVVLGPVRLPEYLSKPYVAWRNGTSQVAYKDDHRWGASLEAEILRATTEHLSRELGSLGVVAFPAHGASPRALRVTLDIERLDVTPKGDSSLRARYVVRSGSGEEPLAVGVADVRANMGRGSVAAAVEAYGELVQKMAKKVAEGLRSASR